MSELYLVLTDASAAAVRALAVFPEVRGDHVTLAHGVERAAFERAWVPGGYTIGARVTIEPVGLCANADVQALLVAVSGTTRRPIDGGVLHVTVSRQPWARSLQSNALLACAVPSPIALSCPLWAHVRWRDEA